MKVLKNCLFLSVTLPLPSTLTLYLPLPRLSKICPDLSHFLAILPAPCWFWIKTLSPGCSCDNSLVCWDHFSNPLMILGLSANSLFSLLSIQTSDGENVPGLIGKKSLIGRPKIISLGDSLYSVSGVFLCCMMALVTLSMSGEPSDLVFSIRMRLQLLTPVSTLKFPWA